MHTQLEETSGQDKGAYRVHTGPLATRSSGCRRLRGRKRPESGDLSLSVGSGAVACPTVRGARGDLTV